MKPLHTKVASQPARLASKIFKLERCGQYKEAMDELSEIWPDWEADPNVEGLDEPASAEILLRCGSAFGYYGHSVLPKDAQLIAKNLLTKARNRFIRLENEEKTAECEAHLAVTFWRRDEAREAEPFLAAALGRDLPQSSDARLFTYVVRSMVDLNLGRYEKCIEEGNLNEDLFRKYAEPYLMGCFCTNVAFAYKKTGNFEKALAYYEMAGYFHQKSRHKPYLGTVENNLASLYVSLGQISKAHKAIDASIRAFKNAGDKTREGYAYDTKAAVYCAEGEFTEALRTIEFAIRRLKKSENLAYLANSLMTKAKILLKLDDFSNAVLSMSEAVQLRRENAGEEAAKVLIKEFELAVAERNAPEPKPKPQPQPVQSEITDNLELVLPHSISQFTDYQGAWIRTSGLEDVGLPNGSLAIIADTKVKPGELAALRELETGEIYFGFFDSAYGIVCLESKVGDPQVFDEKDVKILGKIVGVSDTQNIEDNKLVVRSIRI